MIKKFNNFLNEKSMTLDIKVKAGNKIKVKRHNKSSLDASELSVFNGDMHIATVLWNPQFDNIDDKRIEQSIKNVTDALLTLKTSPPLYIDTYKERNTRTEAGIIQIWDESEDLLSHNINISGPFSDATHNIGGKFIAEIAFVKGLDNQFVNTVGKFFQSIFKGHPKTKNWIEAN